MTVVVRTPARTIGGLVVGALVAAGCSPASPATPPRRTLRRARTQRSPADRSVRTGRCCHAATSSQRLKVRLPDMLSCWTGWRCQQTSPSRTTPSSRGPCIWSARAGSMGDVPVSLQAGPRHRPGPRRGRPLERRRDRAPADRHAIDQLDDGSRAGARPARRSRPSNSAVPSCCWASHACAPARARAGWM